MTLVLPFSGIEIIALGVALYLTSRKVHQKEVITFSDERVRVEKGVQKVESVWECDLARIRFLEGHSRESSVESREAIFYVSRGAPGPVRPLTPISTRQLDTGADSLGLWLTYW